MLMSMASSSYSICDCTNYIFITLTIMKSFAFLHLQWFCTNVKCAGFFSLHSVSEIADTMPRTWRSFFCDITRLLLSMVQKNAVLFFIPNLFNAQEQNTRKMFVISTKRNQLGSNREERKKHGHRTYTYTYIFYLSRWMWLKAKVAEMLEWPGNKSLTHPHPFRSMHLIDLCVILPLLIYFLIKW